MNYHDTIHYLYHLQKYGIKFGLENITRLMSALNNPHQAFHSVHVAGTNGKGSTAAITASILRASGLRAGLFTSPHLLSFTERIRINGEEITEDDVISLAGEIRDIVLHMNDFSPTFFEVVTAMALLYFQRKKVDIAVIEVGMGGRLDATNIIAPEVSVITRIGYDHREFLGTTLKEIAQEKAGIIKDSVPVIAFDQDKEVLAVIEERAREKNAEIFVYRRDFSSVLKRHDINGISFDYHEGNAFVIQDLSLPLIGEHQMENASAAIKAFDIVSQKILPHSGRHNPQFIRKGIQDVRWSGRLEFIHEDPPILIDGAHNPDAAAALAGALKKNILKQYKKIIIILGIMGDKDIRGIMEPLLPLATEIIFTAPAYDRAAAPETLADTARALGFPDSQIAPSVKDAIDIAIHKDKNQSLITHHPSLVLITGSFYTIGEAKEALGQKGVLTRLRE